MVTWNPPGGTTWVWVECWGNGSRAGAVSSTINGSGGGGGAYSRKRVDITGVASIIILWGDGSGFGGTLTKFGDGTAYEVKADCGTSDQGGLAANGTGSTKFSGGNGALRVEGKLGGGPGGGAGGRDGNGATAPQNNTDSPADGAVGGGNAPSVDAGGGGDSNTWFGQPGENGQKPGGGGGGKGYGDVGSDTNGLGASGAVLVYDDPDDEGFPAMLTKTPIASFGNPPTPPTPPPTSKDRKSAFIM